MDYAIKQYYKKLGVPKDTLLSLGRTIQFIMSDLITKLSDDEITKLQDLAYTKQTFGTNFHVPFLGKIIELSEDNIDKYYKQFYRGGFVLANAWMGVNVVKFEAWLYRILAGFKTDTVSSRYDSSCTASDESGNKSINLVISGKTVLTIAYTSHDLFEITTNPDDDNMDTFLVNQSLVQTLADLSSKISGVTTTSSSFNFAEAKRVLVDALNTIEAQNGEGDPDISDFAKLIKEITLGTYGSHNVNKFLETYKNHELSDDE